MLRCYFPGLHPGWDVAAPLGRGECPDMMSHAHWGA
jgi:hypothetical protein